MVMSCTGPKDSPPVKSEPSAVTKSPEKTAKAVDRDPPDLLTQVKEWRDKMCACGDAACADRTYDEFRAWRKSLPRVEDGPGPSDPLERLGAPWETAEAELKVCRKQHK